ncbi:MAG: C-GCAxxG-C-C family protein [Candidatus Thorarchaeota archaeon]
MKEERKQELLETAYEKGRQYEATATDCCQSTIAAIQDTLGCKNDAVLRAGSAFAGGVGLSGFGSCGALTGAVMVIGQLCGRTREEFVDDADREINDPDFDYVTATKGWDYAYEMVERFIIHYGSTICREVAAKAGTWSEGEEHIRLRSPARSLLKKKREESDLLFPHELDGCPKVVGTAAKWATEIILRERLYEPDE